MFAKNRLGTRNAEPGTPCRPAFTMIEMLVVLGVVAALMVIALPIALRMNDRDNVGRAARLLQGALAQAKNRAVLDRQSTGVRLLVNPGAAEIISFEYIQDPGPFQEGWVWAAVTTPPIPAKTMIMPDFDAPFSAANPNWTVQVNTGATPFTNVLVPTGELIAPAPYPGMPMIAPRTVFGPFSKPRWIDATGSPHSVVHQSSFEFKTAVQAGDYFELNGNGQLYNITRVEAAVVHPSGYSIPSRIVLDRDLTDDIPVPSGLRSNYKIYRQPRVVPGEDTQFFPPRVIIDVNPQDPANTPPTSRQLDYVFDPVDPTSGYYKRGLCSKEVSQEALGPKGFVDILFSPSGQVVGSLAQIDVIYLWIRDMNQGQADNQALLAIYTKTGGIALYPVDQTAPPRPPAADNAPHAYDPYKFAKTARGKDGVGGF